MLIKMLIEHFKNAFKFRMAFSGFGVIKAVSFAREENQLFKNLVSDPCEENAIAYIELRKQKPAFSLTFANHPSVWARVREQWGIINRSDRISYEMKKAVMEDLMWQGLYLNNQKIIDNYKGNK